MRVATERAFNRWATDYRRAARADGYVWIAANAAADGYDAIHPTSDGADLVEGVIAVVRAVVARRPQRDRRIARLLAGQSYGVADRDRGAEWVMFLFGASEAPIFVESLGDLDFDVIRGLGCFRVCLEKLSGRVTRAEAWRVAMSVYNDVNTDAAVDCYWQTGDGLVVICFEDASGDRAKGVLVRRDDLFYAE